MLNNGVLHSSGNADTVLTEEALGEVFNTQVKKVIVVLLSYLRAQVMHEKDEESAELTLRS